MEEHLAEIAVGKPVGRFGRDEAALDGAVLYAFVIDAATVVFDFDVNVIAAVIGAQGNFAGFGFSGSAAVGRVFDAVRDGIANQMDKRVGDLLNDVVVQLGFAAGEVEFDLLAGGSGGVADRA